MILILAMMMGWVGSVWCLSSMFFDQSALARKLFFELRPFFPITRTAYWILLMVDGPLKWWNYIFMGLDALCWFLLKNRQDDDDRWNRRKKKVTEKIKALGGKLTVVPAGASA